MTTPTKAILDVQTDLKRSTAPVVGIDVTNKDYVDLLVATATPNATSGIGGGTKGLATCDESKGLTIPSNANIQIKVDNTTVTFDGSGHLQALDPTATAAPGGGTQGRVSADSNLGLDITAGVMRTKIDAATVVYNGSGQLKVTDATSAPGGGVKGVATFDDAAGLHVGVGQIARVKVDAVSIGFDGSGNLKTLGTNVNTTGLVSNRAPFARALNGGVTLPNPITLGTNIDASSYPHGATSGERFEFTVPDDYFAGNLDILLVYSMSAAIAGPNNQVRLATAAELAKVTGSIDSATYPLTQQNLITPTTTSIIRTGVLTLTAGTFESGDEVVITIERIGGSVNDLSTANFQVIAYEWRYTAIVSSRLVTQVVEITSNAMGENPITPATIGTQTSASGYPSGLDAGEKFNTLVPDNWDGFSDCFVAITYAMSTGAGGTVRLNTYGEVANTFSGSISSIPSANYDFAVPTNTNPARLLAFAKVPASLLHKGDAITLVLARRVAVGGNSTAQLNVIGISFLFSVSPLIGFAQANAAEHFLGRPSFGNLAGTVQADDVYPVFGTTFDQLYTASSTAAAGRVDTAFPGRLASFQTQITSIRVNIIGTGASPQYHLQVYAEGTVGTVYDSGLQPAPGVLTELVVLAASLSAQPTGSKRYHVVVQSFIDTGEAVSVSAPFVRQE